MSADVAHREAVGGMQVVDFRGEEYKLLAPEHWPRSVWKLLDDSRPAQIYQAAEKVLGDQWAAFEERFDPSLNDIHELFDAASETSGNESLGNSSRSSGSSKTTGKRSKATSKSASA